MSLLTQLFKDKTALDVKKTVDTSFCYSKFTSSGILEECNENFARLFGYSSEELIGNHHRMLVHEEDHESREYEDFWNQLKNGDIKSGEFTRKHKNGSDVFLRAAYTPNVNQVGAVESIIKIASDITQDKKDFLRYSAIKNSIDLSYAYIHFDTAGNILDANTNFLQTMEYDSLDEIQGRHHSIFVDDAFRNSAGYKQFWENLSNGVLQRGEFNRVTKQGKTVWLQASYSPVVDSRNKVRSVIKIATDITAKKASEEMAKDLKSTIDLSFGYIQFDPQGNILDVNQNFAQLLGYSIEETIGNHHSIFVEKSYGTSDDYHLFWENLRSGKTQEGQFSRITKTGDEVWIRAAYTPVANENGDVLSVIKIAADVTSDKQATEKAKKDLKDELSSNISEIASAVAQIASGARDQAEKIDQSSSNIETSLHTSQGVSSKADEIATAASKGKASSEKGTELVNELVDLMGGLSNTANQTQSAMDNLVKGTEEINSVLNIIQEIASNTNLLALNASIEAAQAGDSGRGFSVIAHEIRLLAENARDSVKQIENQISSMIVNTKEVSKNMQDVTDKVAHSEEASRNVSDIFREIVTSNEQTSNLSNSIVSDSNDQKDQLKQIVGTSEEIVVISEQTAAATEEVATAAQSLEDKVSSF